MHKLEVLKRAPGAAPGGPRVVASAGMTLSFKLPPSYARRLTVPASAAASVSPDSIGKDGEDAVTEKAAEDGDALSWEDQDWEARADSGLVANGKTVATAQSDEEEDDRPAPVMKTNELDDWEQSETPELPDDFPRLIVNLTRLQRQHFPPAPGMEHEQVDMTELVATVKTALHRHFTHMAEALFEQRTWRSQAAQWAQALRVYEGLTRVCFCCCHAIQSRASTARTARIARCWTGCTRCTRTTCSR